MRAVDGAALGRHRHGQRVGGARRRGALDLDAVRARRGRAGATRRRPSRTAARRAAAQDVPVEPHDRGRRVQPRRADADRAAGERDRDVVAEVVRLPPPPAVGEAAAPVLLRVRPRAVERNAVPPATTPPAHVGREQVRVPVLAQPGDGVRAAQAAERPPRPGDRRARAPRRAGSRGRGRAARGRRRRRTRRRRARRSRRGRRARPAAPPSGRSRPDGRPARRTPSARRRATRLTPHITIATRPARGLREAPEVALHGDAVVAPRIAPRRVRAGPAVGSSSTRATLAGYSDFALAIR